MSDRTPENLREFAASLLSALVIVGVVSLMISCASLSERGEEASTRVSFESNIKPLLEDRCVMCHNGHVAAGDLDLRTRELAFRRSSNGPFIVPGDPEASKIFRMVRLAEEEPGAMPPTGHGLSQSDLEMMKAWIREGAEWPADDRGNLVATQGMNWRSQ